MCIYCYPIDTSGNEVNNAIEYQPRQAKMEGKKFVNSLLCKLLVNSWMAAQTHPSLCIDPGTVAISLNIHQE